MDYTACVPAGSTRLPAVQLSDTAAYVKAAVRNSTAHHNKTWCIICPPRFVACRTHNSSCWLPLQQLQVDHTCKATNALLPPRVFTAYYCHPKFHHTLLPPRVDATHYCHSNSTHALTAHACTHAAHCHQQHHVGCACYCTSMLDGPHTSSAAMTAAAAAAAASQHTQSTPCTQDHPHDSVIASQSFGTSSAPALLLSCSLPLAGHRQIAAALLQHSPLPHYCPADAMRRRCCSLSLVTGCSRLHMHRNSWTYLLPFIGLLHTTMMHRPASAAHCAMQNRAQQGTACTVL